MQLKQVWVWFSDSLAASAANSVTVRIPMTFYPRFAGAKNIYVFASNGVVNSGWRDGGDWTVP